MPRKNTALKVVEQPPQPLTETQRKFIDALLTGKTISEAAITAGLSRQAAFYWMADPHSDLYHEYILARMEKRQAFRDHITQLHEKAISAMEASLSADAPPAVRFAAAKFIYSAHLQSSGFMARPSEPDDLVREEIERYGAAINHRNSVAIATRDAKGQFRMTYEDDPES